MTGGVKGRGKGRGVYIVLKSSQQSDAAFDKLNGRLCVGDVMQVQRVQPSMHSSIQERLQIQLTEGTRLDSLLADGATKMGAATPAMGAVEKVDSVVASPQRTAPVSYQHVTENLWLASQRTLKISTSGSSLLGEDKTGVPRNESVTAARLLDICHIVVGVNLVTKMNVTQTPTGRSFFLYFLC